MKNELALGLWAWAGHARASAAPVAPAVPAAPAFDWFAPFEASPMEFQKMLEWNRDHHAALCDLMETSDKKGGAL